MPLSAAPAPGASAPAPGASAPAPGASGAAAPSGGRTRDRILDAALALFADRGYEATSMREIAGQLGITKAALYYHFDSKEDIVRSLLADIQEQVSGLTAWAREQPVTEELRREVLLRWTDIMQAHGITAFRFVMANRQVVHEINPNKDGMVALLSELYALLAGPDASVERQLRVRLALMSVNMAGFVGAGIDAPDEEILTAARRLAVELMP